MSNVTLHSDSASQVEPVRGIMRLQVLLQMTRTFQAFISKTRSVDRNDPDFQFAGQSCHDALTRNLCARRDRIQAELAKSGSAILERKPVRAIFEEIARLEGGALTKKGSG